MDFKELWVEKYRPKTLDDILLSPKNRSFFEALAKQEEKAIPHILLHGPIGSGKTSLAKIIVEDVLKCEHLYLNGSEQNSINDVRGVITNFIQTKSFDGKMKVVFLDEADGLSNAGGSGSSAQKALRNILEDYSDYSRFIFTCNYNHQIIEPIWSRVMDFYIVPDKTDFIKRCLTVLQKEGIKVAGEDKGKLLEVIDKCFPDMRMAIKELQKASFSGNFDPPETIDKHAKTIAQNVYGIISNRKASMPKIRKFVLDNEHRFMGDYNALLKNLFEVVHENDTTEGNKKRTILLLISEALYYDRMVLDKEINFYSTCIKIGNTLV